VGQASLVFHLAWRVVRPNAGDDWHATYAIALTSIKGACLVHRFVILLSILFSLSYQGRHKKVSQNLRGWSMKRKTDPRENRTS
jgi:hypothetical protein